MQWISVSDTLKKWEDSFDAQCSSQGLGWYIVPAFNVMRGGKATMQGQFDTIIMVKFYLEYDATCLNNFMP